VSATQLGLLAGVPSVSLGEVRDPLDRHYTPDALALCCCEALMAEGVQPRIVVEPSVGGGAFARAILRTWPSARIVGVDVDPNAGGFAHCHERATGDWPTYGAGLGRCADLVLGNPPFTGEAAIGHVVAARAVAKLVALILPWSPLGGVEGWVHLMSGSVRPVVVWPIAPRPWPDHVRETALYLWREGHSGRTAVAEPLVWR
jgi:hypothetical protein